MIARATGGAAPASPSWALPRGRAAIVRALVLVSVTVLVLASLASWAGTADVVSLIGSLGAARLLAVLLLTLVLPVTHAWRLQVALRATDNHLSFSRALWLTLAVWPISSLTPAKSGDLVKAYYLRDRVPALVTAGALLAERAVDLAVWGCLSLVASLSLSTTHRIGVLGACAGWCRGLVCGHALGRASAVASQPARQAAAAPSDVKSRCPSANASGFARWADGRELRRYDHGDGRPV